MTIAKAQTITEFISATAMRLGSDTEGLGNVPALLALEAELPVMPELAKCEENQFYGCQSQIWLLLTFNPRTGTVDIKADSDSRIVRGLLTIAIGMYSGRKPVEIREYSPDLLRKAGLIDVLTPSRANGFYRLMCHIHEHACQLSATENHLNP